MNFLEGDAFYPGVSGKQFLYNILFPQIQNASLFLNTIPKKQQLQILSSLCQINLSKNPDLILEKWISLCYLSTIIKQIQQTEDEGLQAILTQVKMKGFSIPDSIYLLPLEERKTKSKDSFLLHQFFTSNSNSQNILSKNPQLLHSLQLLFSEYQPLYTALLKHGYMDGLLSQFSHEELFHTFKLQSFSLKDNFDKNFLQYFSVDLINSNNFDQFWQIQSILFNHEVAPLFQSLFACTSPFPSTSKYFINTDNLNDSILSLVNDVLSKRNKCFVDIILIRCRTLIIDGLSEKKDQQIFLKYTSDFPDLQLLTFLTEYESLKNDINNFRNVIWQLTNESSSFYSISSTTCAPIFIDILIRLQNDQLFYDFLQGATGTNTSENLFEKVSIPAYLLQKSILLINISEFYNKPMMLFSDFDRKTDFEFILVYQIIDFLLTNQTVDTVYPMLEKIKEITSEVTFENIIIDLFSLLFITNKSNKFYFTADLMSDLVTILLKFSPKQKHVKATFLRLKVATLISQKKFDNIKQLAEDEHDFIYKLAVTLEIIQKYRNGEPILFPNNIDKSLLATEYFLSFNEEIGFDLGSFFSQLIVLRKRFTYSPLNFYDIESTNHILRLSFSQLIDNSLRFSNCPLLKKFIDIERIIQSSDDFDLNKIDDLIKIIIKDEKISSILTMKTVPDEYKSNKIISHIILKDTDKIPSFTLNSIEDIRHYLSIIDTKLMTIPDEDFQIILTNCMLMNEHPYDILNDLYYRSPQKVINFFKQFIPDFTVKDFLHLIPFCFYRSTVYLCDFDGNMKLNECLLNLILNSQIKEAKAISNEFELDINSIITHNITKANLNQIQLYFPYLKLTDSKSIQQVENIKDYNISLIVEIFINCKLDKPSYGELLRLFGYIQNMTDRISTKLMDDIIKLTNFFISNSFVDSVQAEINALFVFPRILTFLNQFKIKMINISDASHYESLFNQLKCLCKFVSSCFYSKFHQEYSFVNFSSRIRGIQYASICMKYDRTDLLNHIQSSWILTDFKCFSSSLNCFKMGLINLGYRILKKTVKSHKALKIDCQSHAKELIPVLSLLQPIHVTSFISIMEHLTNLKFDSNFQFPINIPLKFSYSTNNLNNSPLHNFRKISSFNCMTKTFSIDSISSTDDFIDSSNDDFLNSNSFNEIDTYTFETHNSHLIDDSIANENSLLNENFELPSVQKEIVKEINNANQISFIDSPQLQVMHKTLSLIGANEDRIQFYCRYGQFDDAFSLFQQSCINASTGPSFSAFLRVLVVPSLAFQQWNTFWHRLLKTRPIFDPLINDFINYLQKNDMFYILYTLEKKIGHYDTSVYAALKLFEKSGSWKEREELLIDMRTLIAKALESDQHNSMFFTNDALFQLQWRVSIQLPIITLFIRENVPFNKDLELMTSKENTVKIASYLLIMLQVGYFSEICELPDVPFNEVCEAAIEKLSNDGEKKIPQFLKQLTRLEFGTYKKIIMCISQSIYRRVPDENAFVEFVCNNIKGDNLIVEVLQNFGFEQEANDLLCHRTKK